MRSIKTNTTTAKAPPGWPRSRPWVGSGWLSVREGKCTAGMRITDSPYWGAWWAQALRAILYVKQIHYHKVVHPPFSDSDPKAQEELHAWTAQTSVPTMVYGDGNGLGDVVCNDWLNQLMLAERIQPQPPLLPEDPGLRMQVVGLCHEIMSPQGFLWNARLAMSEQYADKAMSARQRDFFGAEKFLGGKYSFNGKVDTPLENARQCLSVLTEQLVSNMASTGGSYFVGDRFTAVDLYWAYASNFLQILPHDKCPVMRFNRAMYPEINAALADIKNEILLVHRNRMFDQHLECPIVVA